MGLDSPIPYLDNPGFGLKISPWISFNPVKVLGGLKTVHSPYPPTQSRAQSGKQNSEHVSSSPHLANEIGNPSSPLLAGNRSKRASETHLLELRCRWRRRRADLDWSKRASSAGFRFSPPPPAIDSCFPSPPSVNFSSTCISPANHNTTMEGQSSNRSADQYSDHSKSRRIWSDVEINALLDVLDDIVAHQGTCDNGTFRPGTARQVEQALATLLPGTDLRASPHIESKMKKLKRDYVTIFDMLSTSGFGWDDARKCVLVDSDEAWLAYVQHHPQARGWRNKSYPIYDRLAHIFGKDRATGIGVETPADMAADTDNEELEINADEVAEGMSPLSGNNSQTSHRSNQSASSSGKRKRNPGGLDKMTATLHGVLERSCNNMEKILEAVTTKRGVDTKFIGDELKKMGYSVYDRARLLKLFGEQPINVDIFKSFDTMEEREEFVLSLYSGL